MWNKLLDASIYYSFDRSGYLRHAKDFENPLSFIKGNALVTGGSSGIGFATAKTLSQAGIEVVITGRDTDKGKKSCEQIELLQFLKLDMGDWEQLPAFCDQLRPLNYIVLNAGGMPENFQTNNFGVESQMASQLFGHYYLLKVLLKQEKLLPNARIVWVSSGGMYLKSLELGTLYEDSKYDKVSTYANVKRAQVTLLNKFAAEFSQQLITGMHPGWVDTPGVVSTIPGFYQKMSKRLRTPIEGADTILWLLSQQSQPRSGAFYFDRKEVNKHLLWFTGKSETKLNEFAQILDNKFSKALSMT